MAPDSSQPLRITSDEVDGTTVVRPVGEVDIASVGILQERLDGLLADGTTRLVLSLEGLDYLDSTGLGCVTAARRRARDLGGEVVLVCTKSRVLRLLTITGLDQVFTICGSVDEAVGKLQESAG